MIYLKEGDTFMLNKRPYILIKSPYQADLITCSINRHGQGKGFWLSDERHNQYKCPEEHKKACWAALFSPKTA